MGSHAVKHYVFIDYATQAYVAVVGLLVLFFHGNSVPGWPAVVAGHVLCLGLVHLLIGAWGRYPRPGPLLHFLRHFYPVLLYTAFYRETGLLNQMFVTGYLDAHFIRLDEQLFGCQPSLRFMEVLPWTWVSEPFYAAYFSYYIMIAGTGLALFVRDRRAFFHYVAVVSFVFYVCYLIYIFLPVMGPRIFYWDPDGPALPAEVWPAPVPDFPASVQTGPFHRLMKFIYQVFEAPGAAFPSSHVAVALSTLFFSFLYLRRIRFIHLGAVILLCLSTVYCRYHYAVDVIAGLVTGSLLLLLGHWLYHRLEPAAGPRVPRVQRS